MLGNVGARSVGSQGPRFTPQTVLPPVASFAHLPVPSRAAKCVKQFTTAEILLTQYILQQL